MPGIIGSSAGMNRTVIGQRMRPPSSRLPTPIVTEAHNDAEAMSTPHCISAKRRACPTAASRAMTGKARIGGSEIAPKPMAATAANSPSESMSNAIIAERILRSSASRRDRRRCRR